MTLSLSARRDGEQPHASSTDDQIARLAEPVTSGSIIHCSQDFSLGWPSQPQKTLDCSDLAPQPRPKAGVPQDLRLIYRALIPQQIALRRGHTRPIQK